MNEETWSLTHNDLVNPVPSPNEYLFFVSVGSVNVTWQLSVAVFIDAACDGVSGFLDLSLPQLGYSLKLALKLPQGLQKVKVPVMKFSEKDDVKLWWPRGYGKQNLYVIEVTFQSLDK